MPYSVLIWLNDGGLPTSGADATEMTGGLLEDQQRRGAGLASGVLSDPPLDRLVYGFYEEQEEADAALELLASTLREQGPIRVSRRDDRHFLIPTASVRYVAYECVERPCDRGTS